MPKGCSNPKGAKEDIKKKPPKKNKKKDEKCPLKKFKVIDLKLTVDAPNDKLFMNDPEHKVEVSAVMTYKKSSNPNDLDSLPEHVMFSFSDPAPDNTKKIDSYKYNAKYLGKKDDANAKYWESHSECSASSDDSFKTKCKVKMKTLEANKKEIAKVYFKPSGVGGNDYKIKAAILSSDGVTTIKSKKTNKLTVWRSVTFSKIYEMKGQTHVSSNATYAKISPYYNPTFVKYTAGTRNEISDTKSVKYIGLWKDATTPQQSWATIQNKKVDETPTATEITDATYTGTNVAKLAKRVTARNKIIAKAQKWTDRIDSAYHKAMDKWVVDAAIPSNTLIGIQHYHPKYSLRGGDSTTNEWDLGKGSTPAWLRVGAFAKSGGGYYYTNLNPDSNWTNWIGLSHGQGRVTVPIGRSADGIKLDIAHEVGHATKSQFKRDVFGPSLDHSVSTAGIMYKDTDGGNTFTNREKKILRGIKP
jgi:hypothetical protein